MKTKRVWRWELKGSDKARIVDESFFNWLRPVVALSSWEELVQDTMAAHSDYFVHRLSSSNALLDRINRS